MATGPKPLWAVGAAVAIVTVMTVAAVKITFFCFQLLLQVRVQFVSNVFCK